jgi:hypothetical protein
MAERERGSSRLSFGKGPPRPSEQTMSERSIDHAGMFQALRHAALFARLRREMWQKFRAVLGDGDPLGPPSAPSARDEGEGG